jgi:NDP-sugar pyrophosphorylase family protein
VSHVDDARRFGTVVTADYGRVVRFVEKSPVAAPGLVNAGLYVLRRSLIGAIPAGVACSLENDLLPRWLAAGIYAYGHTARFIDIGTPESLQRAHGFFRAPSVRARATHRRAAARRGTCHARSAEVA